MACNTITFLSSSASNTNGLIRRSKSSRDLIRSQTAIRRSRTDNYLSICSIDHTGSTPAARPRLQLLRNINSKNKSSFVMNSLKAPFLSFDTEKHSCIVVERDCKEEGHDDVIEKRANWVERLIELRARYWRNKDQGEGEEGEEEEDGETNDDEVKSDCDGCEASYSDDEEEEGELCDISRFLERVAWSDVKLFSQLAFLCNIAYVIPDIKAKDLKRRFGLKFVTSSLERKSEAAKESTETPFTASSEHHLCINNNKRPKRASVAYGIAASAASYVQSGGGGGDEVAACVAASTMTAVVAAGERQKSEAAKDLRSLHSSPCDWFVCDDPATYTRCFVIQGSDSLASWQANLFFEPTKFEGTECLVHRGIYEAAKGMYIQLMPKIVEHLSEHGNRAKIRFTGHSLGGSLSLLLHLMFLKREVLKPSDLKPVVTFGSPFVFCGGNKMLRDLGVDDSQIKCVVMHRDIVPRAFSCIYPDHAVNLLKRLNWTFRSHPCLNQNKLLYYPVGKLFILQPDESTSPRHPLLPQGCSLYALDKTKSSGYSSAVLTIFLNTPHPLETLSDPTAYGSDGTILRDHDSSNYLKAVNDVLKRNINNYILINGTNNSNHNNSSKNNNVLWPLLSSPSPRSWNHETNNIWVNKKEVMTRI